MYSNSDTLAIRVNDLGKCYHIYNQPIDRLKQAVAPRLARLFRKPAQLYYREFWALRNIKLEVRKGETIGIIGRNGSGKSTLLQLIAGTLTPTTGTIESQGRIAALLELGSGFNPEFTGRENVYLNGAILGLSQEEIKSRFNEIAAFADIGDFIEQPVKFYSSGMIVRLAFAVQAMVDPDVLIVDEALAVGDERFQRKCFKRLRELKAQGTSILFVSHSPQQIIELCDRAVLLEQGQQMLISDPLKVVRAYHKFLYADASSYSRVLQEIKELGKENTNHTPFMQTALSFQDSALTLNDSQNITDFFDPSLIPETTEIMPIMGAKINNIRILNSKGREVNNLILGEDYKIEIGGVFLEDHDAVRFGCHIRTRTGMTIAGLRYPALNRFVMDVKSGQSFKLVFNVRMNLLPEVYFVGAGVWSSKDPERLHQVLDFVMFRVLPQSENWAFGHVKLSRGEPEFILEHRG